MKRLCQSSADDRITNLPADVIQRILVLLPIKDAERTSVLSSKWRHRWRSIPQLVFDDRFDRINGVAAASQSETRSKLTILNVYQVLLAHDGPITKFVLSIPGLNSCAVIDCIVLYFSKKGVQDFSLLFDSRFGNRGRSSNTDDDYQMHSSLFSAINLKSLELRSCEFTPPSWFVGFSKLTHLWLREVALPYDFFDNFLTNCPMLEYLRVVACNGHDVELQIVAPLLKSFEFVGSLKGISFKCTPLLSFVTLYLCHNDTHDMVAFFASIPTLQQLHTGNGFLECLAAVDGTVPSRLPSALHQLQVIDIVELDFHILEVFVCLIMSSPNLRRLNIRLYPCHLDDEPVNNQDSSIRKLLEVEDCSGSSKCLQHLRDFTIEDSCGTQVELDLVRFVLATAPLLQRIHMRPSSQLSSKKVTKFAVEAMRFKRLSKEAELIYHWVDKDI